MSSQCDSTFSSSNYSEIDNNVSDNSDAYFNELDEATCSEPSIADISDVHVSWTTIDYGGTTVDDALF